MSSLVTLNTITLGGKQVFQPAGPVPYAYNFFEIRAGAQNVGWGRFLMLRSDVAALMAATSATQTLTLSSGIAQQNNLSIPVVVWEAKPASIDIKGASGSTRSVNDVMLVTVFDARAVKKTTMGWKQYNVQAYGYPYYSDGVGIFPIYFPGTLNSGSEWTWAQLVANLSSSPPTSPAIAVTTTNFVDPGWKPRNLIWSGATVEYALDEVCAKTFNLAAYDWDQNKHVLYSYGTQSAANQAIAALPTFTAASLSPGGAMRNLNTICPKKVYVVYPTSQWEPNGNINLDTSATSPFVSIPFPTLGIIGFARTYSSRSGAVITLHVRDYVIPKENQGYGDAAFLNAANDIADRYTTELARSRSDDAYAGVWNIKPDGYWRSILWTVNKGGATTRIRTNDGSGFFPGDDAPTRAPYRSMGTNGTNDGPRDYAGYARSANAHRPGVVSVYIDSSLSDPLPGSSGDATKAGQKGYYKGYIIDQGYVGFDPATYDLTHNIGLDIGNGKAQECVVCNLLEANQNVNRSFPSSDNNRAYLGQVAFGKIVGWTAAASAGAGQGGVKPMVHCHYLAPKGSAATQGYIRDVSISAGDQTLTKTTGTLSLDSYGEVEGT